MKCCITKETYKTTVVKTIVNRANSAQCVI